MLFLKMMFAIFLHLIILPTIVEEALLARINLQEIKETYTALNEKYTNLSPLIGAAWWESGILHNYYKFGNFVKEKDKPALGDKTIQLIHELFYELSDVFSVTTGQFQAASFFSPTIIAAILGTIVKNRPKEKDLFVKKKSIINPSIKKKHSSKLITEIKKIIFEELNSTNKKIPNSLNKNVMRTATLIVEAFDEAYFFYDKKTQKYPSIMPYAILLALLYQKSNSKKDFLVYFRELEKFIGNTVISETTEINTDIFYENEELLKIKTLIKKLSSNIIEIQHDRSLYERTIYSLMARQKSRLPKKIRFLSTKYRNVSFPNCAEVTLRNIINVLFYNADSKTLSLENISYLHPNIIQENIHPDLKKFFNTEYFSDYNNIDKEEVHTAWNEIVQNIPWVSYVQIFNENETMGIKAPENSHGFIWFSNDEGEQIAGQSNLSSLFPDAFIEAWIKPHTYKMTINQNTSQSQTYIIFDKTHYTGCELAPTLKNIIVLLNSFFCLNIFGTKKAQYFAKPDFNKKIFPKLCDMISISYDLKEIKEIDLDDANAELRINLSHLGNPFSIMCSSVHSDYYVTPLKLDAKQSELDQAIESIVTSNSLENNPLLLTLLTLLFECKNPSIQQIEEFVDPTNKNLLLSRHFFMHLDASNTEKQIRDIKSLLNDSGEKYKLKYLIKRLICALPNEVDLINKIELIQSFSESSYPVQWNWQRIIRDNPTFVEKIARYILTAPETHEKLLSLISSAKPVSNKNPSKVFFDTLLEQGKNSLALKIAQPALLSDNTLVRISSLELYDQLISEGCELKEITKQASQLVLNKKFFPRKMGLKILKRLLHRNDTAPQVLEIANQCLMSSSEGIPELGLKLFGHLIKKHNQELQSLEIAKRYLESTNNNLQTQGLKLFEILLKNNSCYTSAIRTFVQLINSNEAHQKAIAKKFFSLIIKYIKDKIHIDTIKQDVNSCINNSEIRSILEETKPDPRAKKSYLDILIDIAR